MNTFDEARKYYENYLAGLKLNLCGLLLRQLVLYFRLVMGSVLL